MNSFDSQSSLCKKTHNTNSHFNILKGVSVKEMFVTSETVVESKKDFVDDLYL